jgi:late competence protein required for DNA uptake (superfamily II DNA/RNA helicase)
VSSDNIADGDKSEKTVFGHNVAPAPILLKANKSKDYRRRCNHTKIQPCRRPGKYRHFAVAVPRQAPFNKTSAHTKISMNVYNSKTVTCFSNNQFLTLVFTLI